MHETESTDRDNDWIAKYRAAMAALPARQYHSRALCAVLDFVRAYLNLTYRTKLVRVK
jgi:hypothetical protein